MDGVPATTDMHFRNGAVAFAYLGTLLMQFVDEGKVALDDTIDRWMPTLPEADKVTLKMLANQTTGYPDFETDPGLERRLERGSVPHLDVRGAARLRVLPPAAVRSRNELELRAHQLHDPRRDPRPIGGKPLDELLRQKVLGPMGLTETVETVDRPTSRARSCTPTAPSAA